MSDFERNGVTYDEPVRRRTPGTWFADLGDRLARGFSPVDRPPDEAPPWEGYDEPDEPTAAVDALPWEPTRKRFPTALHGYDRASVDAHIDALEREVEDLREQRLPTPAVQAEIERVGEETSAILRVAHEQAAEITRRARAEAERCVADAATNAVAMTEEAKRKLRQLDTETDAVWAERGRLIEDVRNVATALFSLAEDASDRFPEEGERAGGATAAMPAPVAEASKTANPPSPAPGAPNGVGAPTGRRGAAHRTASPRRPRRRWSTGRWRPRTGLSRPAGLDAAEELSANSSAPSFASG